jgi:hypothetical protein
LIFYVAKIRDYPTETAHSSALETLKALFILKLNLDGDFIKKKVKDISIYKQYIKELKIGKDKDYY